MKIGALGDVVMALPAANYLTAQNFEVTWLVGKSAHSLVEHFADIENIISVNDEKLLKGNFFEKLSEVASIQAQLFGKHYDHVLLGHADARYQILTALKSRNPMRFDFPVTLHHAQAYFQMAQKITGPTKKSLGDYFSKPLSYWRGAQSQKIALAPGGAKNILADDDLRRWPLEHYVALARSLIQKGFDVHLFGANSDAWVRAGFQGLAVCDQIGKHDLISLIKEWSDYRFLVTHDSGPLHLASLAGIPVYGLFGPTLPEWRFPLNNPGAGLVLEQKLDCQPCYDGKTYAPCAHKNCLRTLEPSAVLAKIADSHLRI